MNFVIPKLKEVNKIEYSLFVKYIWYKDGSCDIIIFPLLQRIVLFFLQPLNKLISSIILNNLKKNYEYKYFKQNQGGAD
jgi:hypothetical protein